MQLSKKLPEISQNGHLYVSNLQTFVTKLKKPGNGKICVLCRSFSFNQDLDKLSTSK